MQSNKSKTDSASSAPRPELQKVPLDGNLLQAIVDYLKTQPYEHVFQLIAQIMQAVQQAAPTETRT